MGNLETEGGIFMKSLLNRLMSLSLTPKKDNHPKVFKPAMFKYTIQIKISIRTINVLYLQDCQDCSVHIQVLDQFPLVYKCMLIL